MTDSPFNPSAPVTRDNWPLIAQRPASLVLVDERGLVVNYMLCGTRADELETAEEWSELEGRVLSRRDV